MELLARNSAPLKLTLIASTIGIAMSSAHSICATLQEQGYVERDKGGAYRLTLRVLELASDKLSRYDIVRHFYEICDEVPLLRRNAAVITVLDGQDVLYLGSRASPRPLGVHFSVGMRLPAHTVASGRAILSSMSDAELLELYPEKTLPVDGKGRAMLRSELMKIVAAVRSSGYATERGGDWPDMAAFGSSVDGVERRTAVGVMLHPEDASPGLEEVAAETTRELASRLSRFSQYRL